MMLRHGLGLILTSGQARDRTAATIHVFAVGKFAFANA